MHDLIAGSVVMRGDANASHEQHPRFRYALMVLLAFTLAIDVSDILVKSLGFVKADRFEYWSRGVAAFVLAIAGTIGIAELIARRRRAQRTW